MKHEKPEGPCCYKLTIFGEDTKCPDLDDAITMNPKCKKFDTKLGWTVSGKILKCDDCTKEEVEKTFKQVVNQRISRLKQDMTGD